MEIKVKHQTTTKKWPTFVRMPEEWRCQKIISFTWAATDMWAAVQWLDQTFCRYLVEFARRFYPAQTTTTTKNCLARVKAIKNLLCEGNNYRTIKRKNRTMAVNSNVQRKQKEKSVRASFFCDVILLSSSNNKQVLKMSDKMPKNGM